MMSNDGKTARLLIVDDDASNLLLLRRLLEPPYQCVCVQGGHEALRALQESSFDMVLLDVMMPQINGLEVLEKIRGQADTHDLPVVLVSALSEGVDVARGLQLGANDYITKPIDTNVIPARIHNQLMLKRLLDERNDTINQLRSAQQMRERFFRIATHDLKNPLANMRLAQHILRSYIDDSTAAREVLETMRMAIDTMQEVIGEFLDSSLLQTGKLDLKPECVPAGKLIWDVATQYEQAATRKNIALHVDTTEGMVLADFGRTLQVLSNFVSNAIKFSPGGTVVRLWSASDDQRVTFWVSDQGPGIMQEERQRLFKEFSRSSNRPTGGESSTGLGLWIAQHLVQLQGGSVGVECPDSGGSIFWFALPRCP